MRKTSKMSKRRRISTISRMRKIGKIKSKMRRLPN